MLMSNHLGRGNEPVVVLGRIKFAVAVNMKKSSGIVSRVPSAKAASSLQFPLQAQPPTTELLCVVPLHVPTQPKGVRCEIVLG